MRRPDVDRVNRNFSGIQAGAGETALLRVYVSASAGVPQFGVQAGQAFRDELVTGLFTIPEGTPREYQGPGGQAQAAQLQVTLDRAVAARDELLWRGSAYRLAGPAMPTVLGGRTVWRSPLVLAAATG